MLHADGPSPAFTAIQNDLMAKPAPPGQIRLFNSRGENSEANRSRLQTLASAAQAVRIDDANGQTTAACTYAEAGTSFNEAMSQGNDSSMNYR